MSRTDLTKAERVRVIVERQSGVDVLGVTIDRYPTSTRLSGYVETRIGNTWTNGYVRAGLLTSTGELYEEVVIPVSLRRVQRAGQASTFFHADVPGEVQADSTVRVKFLSGLPGKADLTP